MTEKYNHELFQLKADLCKTFADAKRLMIINELRDGEKSVGDICTSLGIGQSLVSRHLSILRQKGVVQTRRNGTTIYYKISDSQIFETCDMMHQILLNQIKKNRTMTDQLIH